ncbi:MAG: hypothetical protein J5838_05715 [Desulfovibrio sp.]|nr:hypothetical protein [Desulfovibrio sp.]
MEKMLAKLARQLDAIDEASLMVLWSKYATITSRFEPTRRWEEAALIFSLIQAKRWKNQLFNYNWAAQSRPPAGAADAAQPGAEGPAGTGFSLEKPAMDAPPDPSEPAARPCRVLAFHPPAPEEAEAGQPAGNGGEPDPSGGGQEQ